MSEIHEEFTQATFLSKEDLPTAGRYTRLIESGPIPVMREQFRKSVDETLVSAGTALVTAVD
jgi:hypothetical protein